MSPPKPLQVSLSDACLMLGVHRSTLYRMRADGHLRLNKIRGRTFVPTSELERLCGGAALAPEPPPPVPPRRVKETPAHFGDRLLHPTSRAGSFDAVKSGPGRRVNAGPGLSPTPASTRS